MTITAPVSTPSDRSAPEGSRVEDQAKPSIPVVDDEEGICSFLSRALERRGWRIEVAGSAEEGAQTLERIHAEVIILDVALPGRAGRGWTG